MYGLPKSVCVCCACDPSVRLDTPSVCFVSAFVCRNLSSSYMSLRAGSQVFYLLMLFLCVILVKSLVLLCILTFGMLCLSAISMMFVKFCWQYVCWWVWWSERKRTRCLPLIVSPVGKYISWKQI